MVIILSVYPNQISLPKQDDLKQGCYRLFKSKIQMQAFMMEQNRLKDLQESLYQEETYFQEERSLLKEENVKDKVAIFV